MSFLNGVPAQSSTGAWAGGLLMSTFAVSTGGQDPADLGLDRYGQFSTGAAGGLTLFRVVNSTSLPNGLTKAIQFGGGNQNDQWGLGVAAFDGLITYGDVVILSALGGDAPPGQPAPAISMKGTTNSTFEAEYVRARFRSPGDVGLQALTKVGGSVTFHGSENTSTFTWGAGWQWMRLRIGDAGGGQKVRRIRMWEGAFEDESTVWQFVNTNTALLSTAAAIGATAEGVPFGSGVYLQLAYIGFTENEAAQPLPGPAQIGAGGVVAPEYKANLRWL